MRLWIVSISEIFKLFTVSMGTAVAISLFTNSVLSTAWGQQPVQSQIQGQRNAGIVDPLRYPLALQERKAHRLIRKPSLPKNGMNATGTITAPTSTKGMTAPPATPTTQAGDSALKEQPPTIKNAASPPIPTLPSRFAGVIQGAPSTFISSVSSAGATATSKPSSQSAGLTAAASGGAPPSSGTVPRQLGRLMSEMPGMAQMIVPAASSTPAPLHPTPTNPAIGLSPASLTFAAQPGDSNPVTQTLSISNTGGGTLTWSASDNASWLTLGPTSGTGNGTVSVTAATGALTAGTYSATITITAVGTTTASVPVTLTVSPASTTITLSPSSLTFSAVQGAANPVNQSVSVTSNGTWTASDNASWLTVSPTSGSGNGMVTASVNTATANIGSNTSAITVTGGGITRTVNVTLVLNAPATSSATLTWTANTEPDLGSYKVYRSTTPGVYGAALATVPSGTIAYTATGLQVGTTYYFTITAVDSAGNESTRSNEVSKSIF